jgi:DNA-binding beta-propeller fold protein YncE
MRRIALAFALLVGCSGVGLTASFARAERPDRLTNVGGTVWVANRGAHTIQGFDAETGTVVQTIAMAPSSQPGDLAYARGKLYVAEEFGAAPGVAIVDLDSGEIRRIPIGPTPPAASARPHHVHASRNGKLVAFGLYGTDTVAVIDTRTDTLLGPWDINTATTNGRAHAGVFAPNGRILYVASDASSEIVALDPRSGEIFWRLTVPGAHELVVTRDGDTAYVSRRTANAVCMLDLERHDACTDVLQLGLPDTLRLARHDRLLTVTLRTMPAEAVLVDTRTFELERIRLGDPLEPTTLAGHQWTSRNGRFTFAAFEGGTGPGVAVIDHRNGNSVETLPYPGRPHGVDLARGNDNDDDGDDD